jgi:hypothetical protein
MSLVQLFHVFSNTFYPRPHAGAGLPYAGRRILTLTARSRSSLLKEGALSSSFFESEGISVSGVFLTTHVGLLILYTGYMSGSQAVLAV